MNSLVNINKRYSDDLYLTFLTKKVEKIASALYLITDHLDKKEPLKWDIRQKGIVLLSDVAKFNNCLDSDKSKTFLNISFKLFEVLSLLELAVSTKSLSEESFEVLEREINLLLSLIKNNFIKINNQLSPSLNGEYFKLKDRLFRSQDIQNVPKPIKDIIPAKGHKKNVSNNEKKNTRRQNITKVLSKGQKLTIKDISKIITDCSEKTIQRELQQMMKNNLLIKEGERRWSRYFIKTLKH